MRVDLYVDGTIPGGPGALTVQPDGRRVAFVMVRAYQLDAGSPDTRACSALWRRRLPDAEGRPHVVTVTGLRGRPGDNPDAIAELESLPEAVQTCRKLAARLGAAALLGAPGPMQTDSSAVGYSYGNGAISRGIDPACPLDLPCVPTPLTPEAQADALAGLSIPGLFAEVDAGAPVMEPEPLPVVRGPYGGELDADHDVEPEQAPEELSPLAAQERAQVAADAAELARQDAELAEMIAAEG